MGGNHTLDLPLYPQGLLSLRAALYVHQEDPGDGMEVMKAKNGAGSTTVDGSWLNNPLCLLPCKHHE